MHLIPRFCVKWSIKAERGTVPVRIIYWRLPASSQRLLAREAPPRESPETEEALLAREPEDEEQKEA